MDSIRRHIDLISEAEKRTPRQWQDMPEFKFYLPGAVQKTLLDLYPDPQQLVRELSNGHAGMDIYITPSRIDFKSNNYFDKPVLDKLKVEWRYPQQQIEIAQLHIVPEQQGQGHGTDILRSIVAAGIRLGCTEATLLAAETGCYAWAKAGFTPVKPDLMQYMRERLRLFEKTDYLDAARAAELTAACDRPQGIWDIADDPMGYHLLQGYKWHGVLRFADAAAMARLQSA